jgi:hypothetical protein
MYIRENDLLTPPMRQFMDAVILQVGCEYGEKLDYQEIIKDTLAFFATKITTDGLGWYIEWRENCPFITRRL